MTIEALTELEPGMAILAGGDRIIRVTPELADAWKPGDRITVAGDVVLHIPAAEAATAARAVGAAAEAFVKMGSVTDEQISAFFEAFARRLEDDATFAPIASANAADVEAARARGRSTTRLVLSDAMRADMADGLRTWAAAASGRGAVIETVEHEGWTVELRRAGLGVVGFVFEGRPNVFADACGVIRSGNTVVFRIGSDALGTAQAIVA
ncbi:MAG: glutamate-5-semialdehyde dehydrogenase, partial [Actinobacteria bacterium]|nr:glutamate-5-semialdehyde dehydrogenase [Actinomycetota bacterium]